jgi:heme-degrading monooxygenase HmoA
MQPGRERRFEAAEGGAGVPQVYTSALWTVKPGQEDAFVAAWNDFADWAKGQPGAGRFGLGRDVEDDRCFMSFAPWEDFDDLLNWRQSDEYAAHVDRLRQYVERFRPSTYELILEVG